MKDLVRRQTSLSEEIEKLLNNQIKMEAESSAQYLAMASWCDRNGYENSADFFYQQSADEREHMMKIFKYTNDVGGVAYSPGVQDVQNEFENFKSLFEATLDQEIRVTQSFHNIIDKCYKANDYSTINFLQWFLEEQREEEFIARRCLELFDVIGEEGTGHYLIDKEVSKVTYNPPA